MRLFPVDDPCANSLLDELRGGEVVHHLQQLLIAVGLDGNLNLNRVNLAG